MRVFCYCPETGVYQGEDFLDERQKEITEGVTPIPPPICVRGEVPIFDASTQRWNVVRPVKKGCLPTILEPSTHPS